MNDPVTLPSSRSTSVPARRGDSLADVLERVLDKGIVIAGDIRVDLLDIELLTIRIRLLISSADKAQELGMAWWRDDPFFTGQLSDDGHGEREIPESATDDMLQQLVDGTEQLAQRVARLEEGNGSRTGEVAGPRRADDANETD